MIFTLPYPKNMKGNYDNKTHGGKATFDVEEFDAWSMAELERLADEQQGEREARGT